MMRRPWVVVVWRGLSSLLMMGASWSFCFDTITCLNVINNLPKVSSRPPQASITTLFATEKLREESSSSTTTTTHHPRSANATSTTILPAASSSQRPQQQQQQQQQQQVYLCSLQWTPDDQISKPCRDLWKWKDAALGDGRDFFVPKPKTIGALQNLLLKLGGGSGGDDPRPPPHHHHHHGGLAMMVTQVSVLSNCARFEILCVCETNPVPAISQFLMNQVKSKRGASGPGASSSSSWMSVLTQSMDVPGWVLDDSPCPPQSLLEPSSNNGQDDAKELERHWEVKEGTREILYHLCEVAAGMASRPRRPERETIFRPFSSRDAHILLQLKRTKELAQGTQVNQLLEYALRAGKAARNPKVVPALKLLQEYGTGDSSKYSMEPPRETLLQVSQAVREQAIEPLVREYLEVSGIVDGGISSAISLLRHQMEGLAKTPTERRWIKKRLHQPTVDLRQGKLGLEDVDTQLELITREFHDNYKRVS